MAVSSSKAQATASPQSYYDRLLNKLRSVQSYQVTVLDKTVLQPSAQGALPRTITSTDQITYKKPNKILLKSDGLMGGATIDSDGSQEIIYSDFTQEYVARPAPTDIVGSVLSGLSGKKVSWLSSSPAQVDGVAVRQLYGEIDTPRGKTLVTLSIKQSDSLPFKVVISLPAFTSSTGNGLSVTRTEIFQKQRLNAPIADSVFKFTLPDGATKVDSVSELSSGFGAN